MATAVRDAVLGSAVDLARSAAEEVAESPELVGEYLGATLEEERVVSHRFASTARGYRDWAWVVTLARVPRGRTPTVSEVDLLPGEGALLGPAWVPWAERLRPGDLGPGDVLPLLPDDERLEAGYEATDDEDADRLAIFELGLGRERVLSREGRSEAATRWYRGSHGPTAPGAVASTAPCSTCGFLVLMAGSLRTQFGVCANEWSPDDGRVVSMDHGCGAHSQTDVPSVASEWPDPSPVVAESDVEMVVLEPAPEEPEQPETPEAAQEPTPAEEPLADAEPETPAEAEEPLQAEEPVAEPPADSDPAEE